MIKSDLKLHAGSVAELTKYVATQLNGMFPADGVTNDVEKIAVIIPQALERMRPILCAVRAFEPNIFNHFNSLQYSTFLYLLARECWRNSPTTVMADRLFYLNRALNAMDLFYRVELPEVFFVSHGIGAVLGNATYGNQLVFFQNVTIGRVGDSRPKIGKNVVLFPGATITGRSEIGNGSVVGAGVVLHGVTVPDEVAVVRSGNGFEFQSLKKNYLELYFR